MSGKLLANKPSCIKSIHQTQTDKNWTSVLFTARFLPPKILYQNTVSQLVGTYHFFWLMKWKIWFLWIQNYDIAFLFGSCNSTVKGYQWGACVSSNSWIILVHPFTVLLTHSYKTVSLRREILPNYRHLQ